MPADAVVLLSGGLDSSTVLAIAGWARYAEGFDEQGRTLNIADVRHDEVVAAANRQRREPTAMLSLAMFDGLRDDPRFVDAYTTALTALHEHGARQAIRQFTT